MDMFGKLVYGVGSPILAYSLEPLGHCWNVVNRTRFYMYKVSSRPWKPWKSWNESSGPWKPCILDDTLPRALKNLKYVFFVLGDPAFPWHSVSIVNKKLVIELIKYFNNNCYFFLYKSGIRYQKTVMEKLKTNFCVNRNLDHKKCLKCMIKTP